MRFFKLRATPNATTISVTFNKQFQPEIISEQNDPFRIEWIDSTSTSEVLIGEKVRSTLHCSVRTSLMMSGRHFVSAIPRVRDTSSAVPFTTGTSISVIILRYEWS